MNDRRLLACAALCKPGRAVDVGTDHGYLAIHLVKSGICESCIACDINEAPLKSAERNILDAGLSDRIETRLTDGLDGIGGEGITNVIIAGMGGELIADIISRAEWLKTQRVNLVLQPMTKWDHLRQYLWGNGFTVTAEAPCAEGKFVYSVIQAVYSGERPTEDCDLSYLYAGLVTAETPDGREYLLRQASRLETVGRGLISAGKEEEAQKYINAAEKVRSRLEVKGWNVR
ncbi:MAG: SAM-dependent methyltransferase [Ruminococcus sp.]|nr:SAM-dependent methyltransferase [Ruminococcus sp.]